MMQELQINKKKILDYLDEISLRILMLNRVIGAEDYVMAYSTARTLQMKMSALVDELSLIVVKEAERK